MTPEAAAQLDALACAARARGHSYIQIVISKKYRAAQTGAPVTIVRGLRARFLGETPEGRSILDLELDDYDRWKAKQERNR